MDIPNGNPRRNAFEALCVLAASESWCIDMYCGTCGHCLLRKGLKEISLGHHPDDSSWTIRASNESLKLGMQVNEPPVRVRFNEEQQKVLEAVINTANLNHIHHLIVASLADKPQSQMSQPESAEEYSEIASEILEEILKTSSKYVYGIGIESFE